MTRSIAIAGHLALLDANLSRTATSGVVNTSVSAVKVAPNLEAQELLNITSRNRDQVAKYIAERASRRPNAKGDFVGPLLAIAELYSVGVFSEGLLRAWEYDYGQFNPMTSLPKVEPDAILPKLLELDARVVACFRAGDLRGLASRVEWEVAFGPIHPFYDACGRIGRYASTLMALWAHESVRVHGGRAEYMSAGALGTEAFVAYCESCPEVRI